METQLNQLETYLDQILSEFLLVGKRCFDDPHHLRFQEQLQIVSQQIRELKRQWLGGQALEMRALETPQAELTRLHNILAKGWQDHTHPLLPSLTERLQLAEQFMHLEETFEVLGMLHTELMQFSTTPPTTPSALERFDTLVKTIRTTLEDEWKFTDLVAQFLHHIHLGQATLADINPDVMDWLWEYQLLDAFQVLPKAR